MEYNLEAVDEAVLALLYLNFFGDMRAWKQFPWDSLGRLHEKGLIGNPVGKAKSVVFSEEGLKKSEGLSKRMFGR